MNIAQNINGYERLIQKFGINNQKTTNNRRKQRRESIISKEFVDKVDSILPAQPWKPGTHKIVSKELGCAEYEVYLAVDLLIKLGRRYTQKDGIIYNLEGKIIGMDNERVDSQTLRLNK